MTRIFYSLSLLFLTSCSTFINSGFMPLTGTEVLIEQEYLSNANDKFTYQISKQSKNIYISPDQMKLFKDSLESSLKENNLYNDESTKNIDIVFTKYFMRESSERLFAGILAGIDNISTTVLIRDSISKEPMGRVVIISQNGSAWGSTESLIKQHAEKIVEFLHNKP
jgi:hypothetical protein